MILDLIQEKIIDLNQNNIEKLENSKEDNIEDEIDIKKKNNILTYGIDIESL